MKMNKKGGIHIVLIIVFALIALSPLIFFGMRFILMKRDEKFAEKLTKEVEMALKDEMIWSKANVYTRENNVSCYIDSDDEEKYEKCYLDDEKEEYNFDYTARQTKQQGYYAAGNMEGITLTFHNGSEMKNVVINKYVDMGYNVVLGYIDHLYNRLEDEVGKGIKFMSSKYKNSEYTIFVKNYGGELLIYGQWSGINLDKNFDVLETNSRKEMKAESIKDVTLQQNQIAEQESEEALQIDVDWVLGQIGLISQLTSYCSKIEMQIDETVENKLATAQYSEIYAYLCDNNTLVLRNSPRENMGNVTINYGKLNEQQDPPWDDEKHLIKKILFETVITPIVCDEWFSHMEIKEFKNIENLDLTNTISTRRMFEGSGMRSIDLSMISCNNLMTTHRMFADCPFLESVQFAKVNKPTLLSMYGMFNKCDVLKSVDLSEIDVSGVKLMNCMFEQCPLLVSVKTDGWDANSLMFADRMFSECYLLTDVNTSTWGLQNLVDAECMFYECRTLADLNVSGWNMQKCIQASSMFSGCILLNSVDVSNWKTDQLLDCSHMFGACESLTNIDLSNWNTANCKYLNNMFSGCESLSYVDLSSWNVEGVIDMSLMFFNCKSLNSIDLENWKISNVVITERMFEKCPAPKPDWYEE